MGRAAVFEGACLLEVAGDDEPGTVCRARWVR